MKLFIKKSLNLAFGKENILSIDRNGVAYFDINNVEKVILFCKTFNVGILGIDSFELYEKSVIDIMEIYDASSLIGEKWTDFLKKSINGAIAFIENNTNPNAVFEFVFVEQTEYAKILSKK